MSLQIYNTLSHGVEKFVPAQGRQVSMYVCGPTVYNYLHIGNFRGAIFFNLVRNWLEHLGYQVTYVYNYTDVDDKIIARARELGMDPSEISEKYIAAFEEDFQRLKLRSHDHCPKVTEFITPIVDFVRQLVASKAAYVVDGEVFFALDNFAAYGKLSGKKLEDLIAGQRVAVDQRKRHPGDFVLWKPAKAGEPAWDSPWGKGRPGWHIECSAMAQNILGETIDIHGGGMDLIFPHHENEIAQGEGRTGKPYCRFWMHHHFINVDDEKMSKSLGNVVLARDFMDHYHPEILKYLVLSVHYRSPLKVSQERVQDAMAALNRIYRSLEMAGSIRRTGDEGAVNEHLAQMMEQSEVKIAEALNDDFNTVAALAAVFEVVRSFNALGLGKSKQENQCGATAAAYNSWIIKQGQLMSLFNEQPMTLLDRFQDILLAERSIDRQQVEDLVERRRRARAAGDWASADRIRSELSELGVELSDGSGGREWKVGLA